MDRNDIDWERLDRYIGGQGTAEERAAAERWIASDPELAKIAATMRTIGRLAPEQSHAWDVRGGWHRVLDRVHRAERPPLRVVHPAKPMHTGHEWRGARWRAGMAAAALLIAATLTLVVTRPWMRLSHHPGPRASIAMREVITRRGQTAVLELADGSHIMLGPGTRLRAPVNTAALPPGTPREIYLDGEAYFEVQHDSTRPFRVHTAIGIAEDIGTTFVVRAFPETRGMQVVVASGEVALHRATRDTVADRAAVTGAPPLTLVGGDVARLAANGITTLRRGVDVTPYLAWTRGGLAFDGALLREVMPELERWYDVDIRLADSALAGRRLTASFRDEPLSQVLQLLALSLDLRVQRHDHVVVLSSKAAPHAAP